MDCEGGVRCFYLDQYYSHYGENGSDKGNSLAGISSIPLSVLAQGLNEHAREG